MSVRNCIIGVLTIGPAYGLQLHAEITSRAAHRSAVNPGQIYATLDRLVGHGLVVAAGLTDDGLPLYALTTEGRTEALDWLSGRSGVDPDEWTEMLDQVLVSTSLEAAHPSAVLDAYDSALTNTAAADNATTTDASSPQAELAALGDRARHRAARSFLDAVRARLQETTDADGSLTRSFASERPRRGRKAASGSFPTQISVT